MTQTTGREIRLRRRPHGMPTEEDFELVEVPVRAPEEGEVLVRNLYMSVDPYMRGRMMDRESYVAPFEVGQVLDGGAVGQVVESRGGPLQAGDHVLGMMGWREYHLTRGGDLMKVDPAGVPLQAYLGPLGMPGLTAYVGLLDVGQAREGQTVFVSAASGAVGGVVCQIARIRGCRVVGSAGSDEKVAWLREEAGVDAAFNYRNADDLSATLREHCPAGIDVYFDNVGGEHLEAALASMNPHGRLVLCGMISQYNATEAPRGPSNLVNVVTKRLTVRGFIVSDHFERLGSFQEEVGGWIREGRIQWRETVVEGLENAPSAFIGLFRGANIGKMLVRLAPDPTS